MARMRILVCLLAGVLTACARQAPPASTEVPAAQSAAPTFIPSRAQLDQFREQGPDPTLRRIAVADYWLHYKLMQATGIEEALGGEVQAVRGASKEIPTMIPAAFTGEGMASGMTGMSVGSFMGMVTSGLMSGLSDQQISDMKAAGPIKRSSDDGSFEMSIGQDGSIAQSMEFAVNANGINGKVKIATRMDTCPDENGRVTIDIEVDSQMSVQGKPGTGGHVHSQMKYERYLDDDAHLIDGNDGGASNLRVRMGGYENFQQQSADITVGHARGGTPIFERHDEQGFSIFRPDEVARVEKLLQEVTSLQTVMAEAMLSGLGSGPPWESGRCIDLRVTHSPGKRSGLSPSAAFDLEALPRVKGDGTPAGGTVTATLTGGARLQPASGKVPADARYGYVGPEKRDESARIAFESRSRRGVGRATLHFDTKNSRSYRVNATSHGATFTGEICSLDQPFVLNVDSITGRWPMEFTPSDGQSGRMKGTYSWDDCTLSGGGPYAVTFGSEGSGTIRFTYNSTAACKVGSRTTSRTSELPLEPAEDLRCD
jgi:hypothetical protein